MAAAAGSRGCTSLGLFPFQGRRVRRFHSLSRSGLASHLSSSCLVFCSGRHSTCYHGSPLNTCIYSCVIIQYFFKCVLVLTMLYIYEQLCTNLLIQQRPKQTSKNPTHRATAAMVINTISGTIQISTLECQNSPQYSHTCSSQYGRFCMYTLSVLRDVIALAINIHVCG